MFKRYKSYFYGSALANSNIRATNAYGWGFQFKKKSFQSAIISYTGVFHIGARIRSRILSKILDKYDYSKKELFDAGCGMGLSSIYFSNRFKKVTGVDLDPIKIKQAKVLARDNHFDNIDFKVGNLLNNKFTSKKYDVVTCFEVIEHVEDPAILLKNLSRILKKNGKIILSFPSKSFLSAIAQKSLDHYSIGFTPIEIKKLSKGTKLVIKEKTSFGNTYIAQLIVAIDFFVRKVFPILSALMFLIVYPFLVFDLRLPVMGVPRGYILILEKS